MKAKYSKQTNTKKSPLMKHFDYRNGKQKSVHSHRDCHSLSRVNIPVSMHSKDDERRLQMVASARQCRRKTGKSEPSTKRLNKCPLKLQIIDSWQHEQYQQYCVVGESFVPITNKSEEKYINNLLSNTASTAACGQSSTHDFKRNKFGKQSDSHDNFKQNFLPVFQDQTNICFDKQGQKNTNIVMSKLRMREELVETVPKMEEIGIQYSARPENSERSRGQTRNAACVAIDTVSLAIEAHLDQINEALEFDTLPYENKAEVITNNLPAKSQNQHKKQSSNKSPNSETLSDLFLKLQFRHLPDQSSFSSLSKNQKEHYSQLLFSLISKLAVSPRSNVEIDSIDPRAQPKADLIPPRKIYDQCLTFTEDEQQIQLPQASQDLIQGQLPNPNAYIQKLQLQMYKRESKQMNWLDGHRLSSPQIDTSLSGIIEFLFKFYCYLQLNYADSLVNSLQKIFGISFHEKYFRVTRGLPLENKKSDVVSVDIFNEFMELCASKSHRKNKLDYDVLEIESEQFGNIYQYTHNFAVFGALNQQLNTIRPFYSNNGEPFPWALGLFTAINQYAIDSQSLGIIYNQIREKIIDFGSTLCGLHVDTQMKQYFPNGHQDEYPLLEKRNQNENKLVLDWLEEKTWEKNDKELFATKVMHEIGELLYQQLLEDAILDIKNSLPGK